MDTFFFPAATLPIEGRARNELLAAKLLTCVADRVLLNVAFATPAYC